MTTPIKSLVLVSFLLLLSCRNSLGDKNRGSVELSEEEMQAVSADVCETGEALKVVNSENYALHNFPKVIAFSSGDHTCALTSQIMDEWYDLMGHRWFFKVAFGNNCIWNNSIWKRKSVRSMDQVTYLNYTSLDGAREVFITGTSDIGATYARDHAGIRMLDCRLNP